MKKIIISLVFLFIFPLEIFAQDCAIIYVQRLKKSTNSTVTYKILFNSEVIGTFKGINAATTANYSEKWIIAKYPKQEKFYLKITTEDVSNVIGKLIVDAKLGFSYYVEFNPAAAMDVNPLTLLPTMDGHEKFSKVKTDNYQVIHPDIKDKVLADKDRILDNSEVTTNNVQVVDNTKTNTNSVKTQDNKTNNNTQNTNTQTTKIEVPIVVKCDVDINIPQVNSVFPKRYALIIGNENYTEFNKGLNKEVNVEGAVNDAQVFSEYCEKTLGIPKKQIKLLTNATGGQMSGALEDLAYMAEVEAGEAELYFYYSGHGLPEEGTNKPYLIPVDVSGTNLKYALPLETVYKSLNKNPTKRVSIFLDACFSGGGRNQGLVSVKGVKINPKEELVFGNTIVFTSSSGEESSAIYKEKQHGYFTYFLLKKLQLTKGNVTYKDLADYIKYNVQKETAGISKKQNPQVMVSPKILDNWEKMKLR